VRPQWLPGRDLAVRHAVNQGGCGAREEEIVVESQSRVWIVVTPERCSGCRLCEVVCALSHEGTIWPEASRIRVFERFPGACTPNVCVQCDPAPCVESCPAGALSVSDSTGAIHVDESACTACGACTIACPGSVPRLPRGMGHVVVCDLCGGAPRCVEICQRAGHAALEVLAEPYRPIYRTFANDPVDRNDRVAETLYGGAIEGGAA